MIKFGEQFSEAGNLKAENVEPCKEIVAPIKMTDEEVDAFWVNEFTNGNENENVGYYDGMLSEIFNCSENDININFDMDIEIQEVLQLYNAENWQELSDVEKISTIKNLIEVVGKKLAIKDMPELDFYDEDTSYGFFDPINNTININSEYLNDSKELVNTITHELRHAYQNMRAEIHETREDDLYRCNFENYISPVPLPGGGYLFFTDYQDQYVEADARAFANKFMEVM